jgi:hypothetical protein
MYGLARRSQAKQTMAPPSAKVAAAPILNPPLGNQELLRRLQPKLTIGAVNDPLEHEADAVAERVMRMPDPAIVSSVSPPRISRKCTACEQDEAQKVQTKREGAQVGEGEAPASVHEVLSASGQALDPAARAFFEPRFGADFSGIRVHHDGRAANSAREVQASAYTVGNRIVFGASQYAPRADAGRHLLAHELAHVLQQGGSPPLRRLGDPAQARRHQPSNGPAVSAKTLLQRATCSEYNNSPKALCEQQKCITSDGADGMCRKTGMTVCACFPSRMWREMLPAWVLALLSAAAIAAIAACFASGACEFGAVVAGLGTAAAAAVIAVLKAAGIRDSGAATASAAGTDNSATSDASGEAPA